MENIAHESWIKNFNKMNSKGVKRKQVVLDIPTKLRILDRLENGHTCVDLAKEFGVGKSTISDIKSAKDKIREFGAEKLLECNCAVKVNTKQLEKMSLDTLWQSNSC